MKKILTLTILIVALLVVGCSKSSTPEGTVKSYLAALQKGDFAEADKFVIEPEGSGDPIAEYYYSKMDVISITKLSEEEDMALVEAVVNAFDFEEYVNAINDIISTAIDDNDVTDDFNELLMNKLKKMDFNKTSHELNYELNKIEGKWIIVD